MLVFRPNTWYNYCIWVRVVIWYDTSGLLLTWPWNAVWLCSDKSRLTNSVFSLNQGPIVLHQLSKVCSAVIDLLTQHCKYIRYKKLQFFPCFQFHCTFTICFTLNHYMHWMYVYNNFTSSVCSAVIDLLTPRNQNIL